MHNELHIMKNWTRIIYRKTHATDWCKLLELKTYCALKTYELKETILGRQTDKLLVGRYLGRDTCFRSIGITGPLLPPFSSR